jgi:cytochrome P450
MQAQLDDVLPLSEPVTLPGGSKTDSIVVGKGTTLTIPIGTMNRSKVVWGPDAGEFRPERWLTPLPGRALEISGYRHLLTFLDGPKSCVLLSVLHV